MSNSTDLVHVFANTKTYSSIFDIVIIPLSCQQDLLTTFMNLYIFLFQENKFSLLLNRIDKGLGLGNIDSTTIYMSYIN